MISRDTLRDLFQTVERARMVPAVDQRVACYAMPFERYDYATRKVVGYADRVVDFTPRDLAREGLRLLLELEHAEALVENAERESSKRRKMQAERHARDFVRLADACVASRERSLVAALGWRVARIFGGPRGS